eukprot:CAMPEP_0204631744 /NCGR_PEP_ID=MMETSP0717-20131115/23405_1 /ASSEMBLY_ACC=CAM_ASM_000666 /TAXON_ID=230516 /ORGANISM="Chaetoceros curvisetus" /LENGTH=457 /DNA_ID=CAMNT_0051649391 /DNA_START=26 /DNA_END=1399 /DNA_ORIENTATION=+
MAKLYVASPLAQTYPSKPAPPPIRAPSPIKTDEDDADADYYESQGLASPESVAFAAKTGKRAVERILHKSEFFKASAVAKALEIQSEKEAMAAKNSEQNHLMNQVIEIDPSHVQVEELLGKGGFCLVHDVSIILSEEEELEMEDLSPDESYTSSVDQNRRSASARTLISRKQDYCVKFLKPGILADRRKFARGIADLAIEAHFLALLNNPHIIKIRGVAEGVKLFKPAEPMLTNEPGIEGGFFLILDKLHSTLNHKINTEWKEGENKYNGFMKDIRGVQRRALKLNRVKVALNLAQAMEHLHEHNICYRDLKPDNIGFDGNGLVKLFDFGLAKELKPYKRHEDGTYQLTANTGSRRYMAPEVALRKRYNLAVDVYSFAILLWEICSLSKPFSGFTEMQHMNLVVNKGYRPAIQAVSTWPVGMKDTITRCWSGKYKERPDFTEVVALLIKVQIDLARE